MEDAIKRKINNLYKYPLLVPQYRHLCVGILTYDAVVHEARNALICVVRTRNHNHESSNRDQGSSEQDLEDRSFFFLPKSTAVIFTNIYVRCVLGT